MTVFLPVLLPLLGALVIVSAGKTLRRCTALLFFAGLLHLLSVRIKIW